MPACLEIFSLSVSHNARGLGIGAKLCNHIEKLAKEQNIDLYLGKHSNCHEKIIFSAVEPMSKKYFNVKKLRQLKFLQLSCIKNWDMNVIEHGLI